MKLEKMCVVCGVVAIPLPISKPGDPVCSCKCYRELLHIVEVMSEEDDCLEYHDSLTLYTSNLDDKDHELN